MDHYLLYLERTVNRWAFTRKLKLVMIHKGIFAVHKPSGITSAKVGDKIRKIIQDFNSFHNPEAHQADSTSYRRGRLKVGHGGTLDKFATGVLVIGIGPDCKQLGTFQQSTIKSYSVVGQLGKTTDTLDASGTVIDEAPWEHITQSDLIQALEIFHGEIKQVPPLFSALRLDGKRFSDHVREASRKGKEFTTLPKARTVHIHSLSVKKFEPPHFELTVTCGSGTYVRSLVRDIGVKLGSVAHVISLVRTRQGPFTDSETLKESQWTVTEIQHAIEKHQDKFKLDSSISS